MGLSVDISIEHQAWADLDDLEALVERSADAGMSASGLEVPEDLELSVVLCDDAFIQNLNRDWRGFDKPTNVLSFPADPSARHVTLGDVVLAYETTRREASDEGKSLRDHASHLIIHGVLHLLGYDHEKDRDAEAMERLETRALSSLGIASPYEDATTLRAPAP